MRALLEKAVRWWALLGGAILLIIILVTVTNVGAFALDKLARMVGESVRGLPGYEDFVRLAISGAALMFLPYCQLQRGHVSVDLFVERLPRRARTVLAAVSLIGFAALAMFLAYWMALGMIETRADGAVSRVLGWPEWPFYLPGILSLALWAGVAVAQLIEADPDG